MTKLVKIKRSDSSLHCQLLRSYINGYNASLGLGDFKKAMRLLEDMKVEITYLEAIVSTNPSIG